MKHHPRRTLQKIIGTVWAAGLVCSSAAAHAADVRIVDEQGLTRAIKTVKTEAEVVIELVTPDSHASFVLSHADGIAGDRPGSVTADGKLHFEGVREGTWRIVSKGGQAPKVRTVKIVPHSHD